ncbi:MAG: class I SAM-dependent methyltransferase [Clostridia bacterium]|nr:class I SAM-dependent methyltransferase [Clostridia bacterium]
MYEVISKYYDLFMEQTPWVDFAVNAVKNKGRGADVGCGSGNVTIALSANHDVIAIDSSPEMLTVASERFRKCGLRIRAVLQDAEKLQLGFKAEFITAMCDVVNYMRHPQKFFKSAYDNLQCGGVLVFDVSSEYKLKNTLGNNVYTETKNNVTYVWENTLNAKSVDMNLTFFVPSEKGLYKKFVDVQTQYIHSEKEIVSQLEQIGFKVEITDTKDRIYFVATKAAI